MSADLDPRRCYCGLWQPRSEILRARGVPEGFSGRCYRCGAPGHTPHFPVPVPVTGTWCDRCHRRLFWTQPAVWLAGLAPGLVAAALAWKYGRR